MGGRLGSRGWSTGVDGGGNTTSMLDGIEGRGVKNGTAYVNIIHASATTKGDCCFRRQARGWTATSTSFTPVQPIKATVVSGDKPGFETGVKDGIGRWVDGERQTGEIDWVVTLQSLQSAEETTKSANPSRTGDEEWEGRGRRWRQDIQIIRIDIR